MSEIHKSVIQHKIVGTVAYVNARLAVFEILEGKTFDLDVAAVAQVKNRRIVASARCWMFDNHFVRTGLRAKYNQSIIFPGIFGHDALFGIYSSRNQDDVSGCGDRGCLSDTPVWVSLRTVAICRSLHVDILGLGGARESER